MNDESLKLNPRGKRNKMANNKDGDRWNTKKIKNTTVRNWIT
jgi:hypothetical protein